MPVRVGEKGLREDRRYRGRDCSGSAFVGAGPSPPRPAPGRLRNPCKRAIGAIRVAFCNAVRAAETRQAARKTDRARSIQTGDSRCPESSAQGRPSCFRGRPRPRNAVFPVQVFWPGAQKDNSRDAEAQRFRRALTLYPCHLTRLVWSCKDNFVFCSWAVGLWTLWGTGMLSTSPQGGTPRGRASCTGAGRPIASRTAESVAEQGSPVAFSLLNPNSCSVPLVRARMSQDREPEKHD